MSPQPIPILRAFVQFVNAMNEWIGRISAWFVLLMVLVIVYDVTMRAVFSIGSVMLQELQWHLFALLFLISAGYTLKHDGHVRVDIWYQSHWSNDRVRAWVNLLGGLLILTPFCVLIMTSAWPFVYNAYQFSEGSPDPGGLPYRFVLKGAIIVGFGLLMIQGLAQSVHSVLFLLGHMPPAETQESDA